MDPVITFFNWYHSNPNKLLPWIFSKLPTSYVDGFRGESSSSSNQLDFLDDHIKGMDSEGVDQFFAQLYEELRRSMNGVSVQGNFQQPLNALLYLVNHPVAAKALVNHPLWIPEAACYHGRFLEVVSILGPFFHISALPDFCSADLSASFTTVKSLMKNLQNGLAKAIMFLLENTDTRVNVVAYIVEVIDKNSARGRLQYELMSCASSGMFLNLCVVMLQVCQPFVDDIIDPKYLFKDTGLNFRGLTALNASESEVAEWFIKHKHGEDLNVSESEVAEWFTKNKNGEFLINSGWFFMTARVLNLGLINGLSHYQHLDLDIARCKQTIFLFKSMGMSESQGVARLEKELQEFSQEKLCYEAQIVEDEELIKRALSFYRLIVVWFLRLVGGVQLPLPTTCPKEFAIMPEHLVEDAMELFLFASQNSITVDGDLLKDFMNFIIMFMAAPEYIRNPSLRAKMVEVLYKWMERRKLSLFEGHQMFLNFLVKNLMKAYADVEFTSSHTQLDKIHVQLMISKLLGYLWEIPSHRDAWIRIAEQEERGIYLNFLIFLIDNSVHFLETRSKYIERQGLEDNVVFEELIRMYMHLANENVSILKYTSEKITAPFLRPEMVEKVASMLNYFLLQLVGPQRKCPKLKDPAKYEYFVVRLLHQIVGIYINLIRGDKAKIFPAAIVKDSLSYSEGLFSEALNVLQLIGEDIGEDEEDIWEFIEVECKAKVAATKALEVEAALGEIPDEFLDPIQYTLMKEPVILPSSGVRIDRPVIERHLLSSNYDPFNRSPLSIDMLKSDMVLKAKIDEFIRSREPDEDEDCITS